MARPLRLEYPGALYHITCRGNARDKVFLVDPDRALFLEVLSQVVERFNWRCHAYCQMTNHFHLLVETVDPTLARGMRQLNGVYTQQFNRRHRRTGHVFQGRFKAILVERDAYLLELARYVVLNPVRAKMVRTARDWPWSSYRATAGFEEAPSFLTADWTLEQFGPSKPKAQSAYRTFVSQGRGVAVWENLRGQIYLGSSAFIEEHAPAAAVAREIPRAQQSVSRPALAAIITDSKDTPGIARAYLEHRYTQQEIADHLGVHYSTISRRVRAVDGRRLRNTMRDCKTRPSRSRKTPPASPAYLEHRYTQQEIAVNLGVHDSTISRGVRAVDGRRFGDKMRDYSI
jgi:REP element-mobilizing transposase RayT/Trp operon repressor